MAGPKCGTCNLPKIGMIRIPDDESDYMCGDCIRINLATLSAAKADADRVAALNTKYVNMNMDLKDELKVERERVAAYEKALGLIGEHGKDIEVGYRDLENLARDALGKFR